MKKNLGMFLGLPRRGARAVLPALFTFTAACVLSVSSAQAAVTTWTDFSAPEVAGTGPYPANPLGSDFASASLGAPGGSDTPFAGSVGHLSITAVASGNSILTFSLDAGAGTVNLASITYDYGYTIVGSPTPTPVMVWTMTGFTSTGTENNITTTGGSGNIDLSSAGPFSGTFTLVGTLSGTATGDNINFSDFSITTVPEPVNYALAGFGLLFVGVGAGRFYLGRRRLATAR
jgi:hypothetical protein